MKLGEMCTTPINVKGCGDRSIAFDKIKWYASRTEWGDHPGWFAGSGYYKNGYEKSLRHQKN